MYRSAQQWNQWLSQPLGHHVLEAEKHYLLKSLATYYGKHVVLIGVPHQDTLLKTSVMSHQVLLTPLMGKTESIKIIESDFYELPIASGSVDLVFLPHSLEYIDNPRQLLTEACRIVKPEGHIIILGFNPFSLWGLKKTFTQSKTTPWNGNFIPLNTIKKWLALADFEWVTQDFILHEPPSSRYFSQFRWVNGVGRICFRPLGGVYSV